MIIIKMQDEVGIFAENKETARALREEIIMPNLLKEKSITFDFEGVSGATQSFIHALLSEAIRQYRNIAFNNLFYKNANEEVKAIIKVVYRYMQESIFEEGQE